ncbi:MAG: ccmI [Caulobacter sp.]|nr:ccmI [Caulobacter sp.]
MIAFWIAAAGLSAATAALVLRGAARAVAVAGEDVGVAVHRRQLAEIDDLAQRGLLAETELRAARTEAGRRLLAAADHADVWPTEGPRGRRLALAVAAVIPLLAVGVYLFVGAPGTPDEPYLRRVAQWRASDLTQLDPPRIAAVLEGVARQRPTDPQPLKFLARARLAGGDAAGAEEALRKAVRLAPQRADLWVALGETFVVEGDGQVGTDAQLAFREALKRDPADPSARYHLAKAQIADGRLADGLAAWRALLASLPPASPAAAALSQEVARVERQGGLAAGPSPAEAAATSGMIQGMVDGLAARLAADPNDPEGWVRLVRAYAVLGDAAKRDAALASASARYRDQPKLLAALRQAAQTPRAAP